MLTGTVMQSLITTVKIVNFSVMLLLFPSQSSELHVLAAVIIMP